MSLEKHKLAIVVSHPIQYQTPLFGKLAKETDLTVYFCWSFGVYKKRKEKEFREKILWDIPLLEGYDYTFLKNISPVPGPNFLGEINPGIIIHLLRNRYDGVFVSGWNAMTNWFAIFTAFFTGQRIFLRGESPLNQELLKSGTNRLFKKIILGTLFRMIDAFLYIGEENKKFYKFYGVPDNKLFFVPYAVDNSRFTLPVEEKEKWRRKLREEWGVKENETVIMANGKLIPKKRPMDLVRAFEKLSKKDVALVFVGEGFLRAEVEKHAKVRGLKVVITGFVNQENMPGYYAAADIFAFPSGMGETWGVSINEAMCSGLPVLVASLVGSTPDLVVEGENGYVVPTGDIEGLKNRLELLVQDKGRREKYGQKSLEVIKKYSYENDVLGITQALHSK